MTDKPKQRRIDLRDIVGLAGAALVTGGVAMMHAPAALIVGGLLLLAGAIMAARN